MKRNLILIVSGLVVVAALAVWKWSTPAPLTAPKQTADGYYTWTAEHLKAGLARKDFVLVNVHVPFQGRIAKTDREFPYTSVDENLDQLPADRDAKIVLYCMSGRMSEIAAKRLGELGYTNVASLSGGMVAWQEAGGKLFDK